MVEIRFRVLRGVIDIIFCIILFFGFMCGVHYGTQFIGLYFWYVKFLLGIVGAGLAVRVMGWLKSTLLFMVKNGSIYAECRKDCSTVTGAFSGVLSNFKETISITVFNKLIRESLDDIKGLFSGTGEDTEGNMLEGIFEELGKSRIAHVSGKVFEKAFDYADECILGYCFAQEDEEKSIITSALEAFVVFVRHSPEIFGKVITIITIELILKIVYWIAFILYCANTFYFGFNDLGASALNLVLCYCVGKLINFILEDAVFEPTLMHGVIAAFIKYEYEGDGDVIDEFTTKIPALGRLRGYSGNRDGGGAGNDESE